MAVEVCVNEDDLAVLLDEAVLTKDVMFEAISVVERASDAVTEYSVEGTVAGANVLESIA